MDRFFALDAADAPTLRLRAARVRDLPRLPSGGAKSDAERLARFEGYLGRPDEYLFVVEAGGRDAGTIGARVTGGAAEITSAEIGDADVAPRARALLLAFLHDERGTAAPGGAPAYRRVLPGAEASPKPGHYAVPIRAADLPADRPAAVSLDEDVDAVAVRVDGGVKVYRDLCPHMGAPLSRGTFSPSACALTCPWHGYVFDARTGEMTKNPNDAIFAPLKAPFVAALKTAPPKWRLKAMRTSAADGLVRVERDA